MDKKKLLNIAKLLQDVRDKEAPKLLADAQKEQKAHLEALQKHPKDIASLPNVKGLAVGYHYKKGKRTDVIGPVVYVAKKVASSRLRPAARIPSTISVRGKVVRVDVVVIGPIVPTCEYGIPDTQHAPMDPIPPGVAICSIDPVTGAVGNKGTGGAIVRRAAPGSTTQFLLTAAHVMPAGQNMGQPWNNPNGVGGHVASSATYDASINEIQHPTSTFHCIGAPGAVVAPIVGMAVKKSGAATGVTCSVVIALAAGLGGLAGTTVVIDNDSQIPPQQPGSVAPYTKGGDSGSVALCGNPMNPNDFGPSVNALIATMSGSFGATLQPLVEATMRAAFSNAVIALTIANADNPGGAPPRLCLCHAMNEVLPDLGIVMA